MGAQPLPWVLERAAHKVADATAPTVQARGCAPHRYQLLHATPLSITPRREEEAKANWLAIRSEAKRRRALGLPASIGGVWGF